MERNIHSGHRQRLKEKFNENGIESLTDVQILEFILFYGNRRGDTNEVAHKLLDSFGSLDGVFDADMSDLTAVSGVSDSIACLIKLIPQVSRVYHSRKSHKIISLSCTGTAAEYFAGMFKNYDHELFSAVYLDAQNNVKKYEVINEGIIGSVDVSIRKIVQYAMKYNASSIIISHNHPGGECRPSASDITATRKISEALYPLEIRLLDHIIITQDNYFSFADEKISF